MLTSETVVKETPAGESSLPYATLPVVQTQSESSHSEIWLRWDKWLEQQWLRTRYQPPTTIGAGDGVNMYALCGIVTTTIIIDLPDNKCA